MMHLAPDPTDARPVSEPAHLQVRDLTKRYGDFAAVDRLTLAVAKGELLAFLGPSGCGKTTSLRMIAGLVPATSGEIVVAGRTLTRVPPYRRDMGLVFQSYALFPHMSVAANVAFGLEMRNVAKAEREARVREAIRLVRLEGMENRRPSQISGGQQQRVALARALVIRPSILLLDEPLSNLDAKLRDEMRNEIRDIQQRLGMTTIFVTHDQNEALTMCDRVAVMNAGRLEQLGTPEDLYERPASPFVAAFVGRSNRIAGRASGDRIAMLGIAVPNPGRLSGPVQVMIRPHRLSLAVPGTAAADTGEIRNRVQGRVVRAIYAGDLLQYDVDVAGTLVSVEQSTVGHTRSVAPGTDVELSWRPVDAIAFEATP